MINRLILIVMCMVMVPVTPVYDGTKDREYDQILIFFSGHGIPDKNSKEVGYLVPYNEDLNRPSTTLINMDHFESLSKRLKATHVMFIQDTCYSGMAGAFSSMTPSDPEKYSKQEIKSFMGSRARHILTAGRTSEKAKMLPDRDMSAFAFYLKQGLEPEAGYSQADLTKDGIVLTSEQNVYLRDKMKKDSRINHTPCLFNFTEDSGEFVFVPRQPLKKASAPTGTIKVLSQPSGTVLRSSDFKFKKGPVYTLRSLPITADLHQT